ncbi:MAG: DUF541 domain-containing protein, partial [Chloroflexi bacterium]
LKRIVLVGLVMALMVPVGLAAIWLWGEAAAPAAAQTEEEPTFSPSQTITVVGIGTAGVAPDIARVTIGVEILAPTVAEAVEQNETTMAAVLAALRAAGIADRDIQTTNYSITLERYGEPTPRPDVATEEGVAEEAVTFNYRFSNMVTVTVRDLDAVAEVVDAVVEAGANNIWGVSFTVEDMSAAQANARGEAIEDARARAEALAELSGVTLGPVMSISEVVGVNQPLYAAAERAMQDAGGSISPGELEIGYQVQVTYFIAP